MADQFEPERAWAYKWLFEAGLPLWCDVGRDSRNGGWFDRIDQSGRPVLGAKRARVQARQSVAYAEAGRLGWQGPWREAVAHGVDFLFAAHRREDGLYRSTVTDSGAPTDDVFDLYDQAFVLLALASAFDVLGRPDELRTEAEALLAQLKARLSHPVAGFEEHSPRRLPLRSNPHMHFLEALLAWIEAADGSIFRDEADAIVKLALERLIDPSTGAIGEYYDGDWRPMRGPRGQLREPGHQFEWAYLLTRATQILAIPDDGANARLEAFGSIYGVDPTRETTMFSVDAKGVPIDRSGRLWAQTERLRTQLMFGARTIGEVPARHAAGARAAFAVLQRFLDVPVRGLWLDRVLADGRMVNEPAPASSFYHIIGGLLPLVKSAHASPRH